MLDLLLAVAATALLLTVALTSLVGVTVAPFLVALQRADDAGASPVRVGALVLAASALGLGTAALGPRPVSLLALLLGWLVALLVGRVPLGRRPRHA